MKRTIIIVALVIFACAAITSCAATKGSGCKGTQGYVGYGGLR
jgi:predicted small secreted protein